MRRATRGLARPARRWRRTAILLSAIWFVGLALVAWSTGLRSNADFLRRQFSACLEVLDRTDHGLQAVEPTGRDDRRSANWISFKSCEARAETLFSQIADDQSEAVPLLLTVDFLTVLIGWLCVGTVVLVVRRLGRGLAPG
jgi:hypothetical protein